MRTVATSPIHPELQKIARRTPRFTLNSKIAWVMNTLISWLPAPKTPKDITIENVVIKGQDAQTIRLRVYKPISPPATPMPVLIWLHGGGYVIGKPEMDDRLCTEYVREAGIVVVSVDYRRAPQHPFPAGLEDSYAALKWVASHSEQLHADAKCIAIGGASAGGGLAAALAQCAFDRQEVPPAFQLLIYPMLDDRTVLRADIDDSNNVAWNHKSNRFGWQSYLGQECGSDTVPAYSVPARRQDLAGLPPAWIGVGTLDIFHNEDVVYGQRLTESGVECEMVIIPGAFHGFDALGFHIPIVQDFRASQIAALKKHLCP